MFDSWLPESKDHLPLTWWKQHPIYLAAFVALASAASMMVFAILGVMPMVSWFSFSVGALQEWKLWTPFTYALVNAPDFWTLVSCYLLWRFGEAVERHLGRRIFAQLLVLLLLSSPVMITLLHLAGVRGMGAAGIRQLDFAVFVAFATLYPRAQINMIIVTIDAWVLASILVAIDALQWIAYRQWTMLLLLAVNVGAAYLFIRYQKGELRLPSFSFPKRAAKSTQAAARPASKQPNKKGSSTPTVDDILDKISHQGMQSLTAEERRILDQASDQMKRKR